MRVLGIDPGYERLGIAILERNDGRDFVIHSDCLRTQKESAMSDRLHSLGTELTELFTTYKPERVAIESLYFNKNHKTAIAVAEVRGVVLYLARVHGAEIYEYSPQEIKVATTGYGKSDKSQVALMLTRLLPGLKSDMLDDEYDAIATALTCLASAR